MSKGEEDIRTCEVCGASIYPEMLKKGTADWLAGRLLCPHCLQEKRKIFAVSPGSVFEDDKRPGEEDEEPIALAIEDDDLDAGASGATKITAFGGGVSSATTFGGKAVSREWKRALLEDSTNATRCRTFHCKLNDSSMAVMNESINEWVDSHPEIQIKFATSCIGPVEGKSSNDPHLILTIFY